MRRALLGFVIPLAFVSTLGAQEVQYYENVAHPEKGLDADREQCNEIARAQAAKYVYYATPVRPAPLPNNNWGTLLGGLTKTLTQTGAQQQFDIAFAHCIQELGWTLVSASEIASREESERRAVDAKSLADADEEVAKRAEIDAFRARVPTVEERYDDFEEQHVYSSTFAYIPSSKDVVLVGGFLAATRKNGQPLPTALLSFQITNDEVVLGKKPTLTFIVDGNPPIHFPEASIEYEKSEKDGLVHEEIYARVTIDAFKMLSTAKEIRARLGSLEFTMPEGHLAALRDISAKLSSIPPVKAAVKKGRPALPHKAPVDKSDGHNGDEGED